MDVIDAINSRSTARAFKPDPVGKDIILKILETATRSPSWDNSQPWELFVAGGDVLERLREGYTFRVKRGESRKLDIPGLGCGLLHIENACVLSCPRCPVLLQ